MWEEIAIVIKKNDLLHSVYADDITISGDLILKKVVWEIKMIIHKHGHTTKKSKELSLINAPADITGAIVANNSVLLPNRQMKKIADLRKQKAKETSPKVALHLARQLSGRLAQKKQVESV